MGIQLRDMVPGSRSGNHRLASWLLVSSFSIQGCAQPRDKPPGGRIIILGQVLILGMALPLVPWVTLVWPQALSLTSALASLTLAFTGLWNFKQGSSEAHLENLAWSQGTGCCFNPTVTRAGPLSKGLPRAVERESRLSQQGLGAGAAARQEGVLPASAHLLRQKAGGKAMACGKTMTIEQLSSKPREALVLLEWTSGLQCTLS